MKTAAPLSRLQQTLPSSGKTGFLVTAAADLRYLIGFTGSVGVLAVHRTAARFFTAGLYRTQARQEVSGAAVAIGNRPMEGAVRWLQSRKCKAITYDSAGLSAADHLRLQGLCGSTALQADQGSIRKMRSVKANWEVDRLRASQRLTGEVFEDILSLVKPGVAERDLAAEIDFRIKRRGAEGLAFDTIVASGPRSALPHARPGGRKLRAGELVVFDFGAKLQGYCGDMTRTIFLGKPPARVKRLYSAVRESLMRSHEAVRAGVRAVEVDSVARRSLMRRRLGRYFVHGTGHGVGLEVHEAPSIGPGSADVLRSGMVITLEPGVYVPGLGGVRIEDLVAVRPRGCENLTSVTTEMICL